jgi:hypothetical protein
VGAIVLEPRKPHAVGIGGYVDSMAEYEEDRVRASYGSAKYDRLARIKTTYDPENVFRRKRHHQAAPLSVRDCGHGPVDVGAAPCGSTCPGRGWGATGPISHGPDRPGVEIVVPAGQLDVDRLKS